MQTNRAEANMDSCDVDPDILAKMIGLRGVGRRYWCPFCQNDGLPHATPDLSHAPGVDHWKCFRCGWSGNNAKLARSVLGRGWQSELYTTPRPKIKRSCRKVRTFETPEQAAEHLAKRKSGIINKIWKYNETMYVVRIDTQNGKIIRPIRFSASNGGFVYGLPKPPRPIYVAVPKLRSETCDTVCIVEGEKCADAVASIGYIGATSPGGAHATRLCDWSRIVSVRRIVIIPDNDNAGEEYANGVIRGIGKLGRDDVQVLRLPSSAPKGYDVADMVKEKGILWTRMWIRQKIEQM